jgi:hypothetical protein
LSDLVVLDHEGCSVFGFGDRVVHVAVDLAVQVDIRDLSVVLVVMEVERIVIEGLCLREALSEQRMLLSGIQV